MKILASFDDGAFEDMRLLELCVKYGLEDVTFYIPADWQEFNKREGRDPLTLEEVEIISELFKIGSHTITHPMLTRIPIDVARMEIEDSRKLLEYLLDVKVDSFCYPRGYANDELRDIVRENYKTARNTLVGNIKESPDPVWQTPTVHVGGKRRPEYENTTWLDEGIKLLEEAVRAPDSVYHIWGHSWELTREDGWHDLEKLLNEVSKAQ